MKHLLSLAVLMVITISAASTGQQTITSDDAYAEGLSRFMKGDTVGAVILFQEAAKTGSNGGSYLYGLCLIKGIGGVKVNQKAGIKLIQKAAEDGEPNALYFLGTLHETGEYGYKVNKTEALRLYTEASEKGSFEGLVACGNMYFTSGDTATAINIWTQAVEEAPILPIEEQRESLAQITYNLGFFYQYGCRTIIDFYEASVYYLKAIHYGNKNEAAYQLGMFYLESAEEPNKDLAAYYFTIAATTGNNLEAYVQLGHIERYNGFDEQALIYYLTAAHGGSTNGMYCLAVLYYDRNEYESAIYWASQCTDYALAEYLLALAYYSLKENAQAKYYFHRCVYRYHLDDAINMLRLIDSGESLIEDGLVVL